MTVSVVVVGFGSEPDLDTCLRAVVDDAGPAGEVVLVDNGIETLPTMDGVTVVPAPRNLGFAGGARLGVERSTGDVLVFVNSDAVIEPGSVAALARSLDDPAVGMVCGCVVLASDRDRVNSVGNPVHVTGISWAGGMGDPVTDHQEACDVASVTGALFAMRREVWDRLGGLDASYFMYYEDADLSLRCWLAGLRVSYCPGARATHSYDFARNPEKLFLLERNRMRTVLTVYPWPLLARALPVLAITEPPLLAIALRDHWFIDRARAWLWVGRHAQALAARRRSIQRKGQSWELLLRALSDELNPPQLTPPPGLRLYNRVVRSYWRRWAPTVASPHTKSATRLDAR